MSDTELKETKFILNDVSTPRILPQDPFFQPKLLHIISMLLQKIKEQNQSINVLSSNTIAILTYTCAQDDKSPCRTTIPQSAWPFGDTLGPSTFRLKLECLKSEILDFIKNSDMTKEESAAEKDLETKYLHIISVVWEKNKQACMLVTQSDK
jgi:hypothetical protein